MSGRAEAERSQRWCGRVRAAHRAPVLGEKRDPWEQEKPFLTQTRVLGHATPPQCLAMQDAEMETVAPGAVVPRATERCTNT